jgi:hypothetical protein
MPERVLPDRIRRVLNGLREYQPIRVYLFGSWARGEADELSDIDLVVIKDTSLPFFDRARKAMATIPPGSGAIDLLVYTPEEFSAMCCQGNVFAHMVEQEGEIIYARESKTRS